MFSFFESSCKGDTYISEDRSYSIDNKGFNSTFSGLLAKPSMI